MINVLPMRVVIGEDQADIRMPPGHADDGLQAALRIRAEHPEIAVLVLSRHVQRTYATELVEQGTVGVGYLLSSG